MAYFCDTLSIRTVHYPSDARGKGSLVVGFTKFIQCESAAFNTDVDTYDGPNFGITVLARGHLK